MLYVGHQLCFFEIPISKRVDMLIINFFLTESDPEEGTNTVYKLFQK